MSILDNKEATTVLLAVLVERAGGRIELTQDDFDRAVGLSLVEDYDGNSLIFRLLHCVPGESLQ